MNAQFAGAALLGTWLLGAVAAPASAQLPQTGAIVGRVVDAKGGVIPGVTVDTSSPSLIRPETVTTDARGLCRPTLLPIERFFDEHVKRATSSGGTTPASYRDFEGAGSR